VPIHWDDIEILCVIDEADQGQRSRGFNGRDLGVDVAALRDQGPLTSADEESLVRELLVLQHAELLTWQVMSSVGRLRPISPDDPNDYLQNIRDFALTYKGRNQARGRVIQAPLPDPAEDDRRSIATLTLEDVAQCIDRKYASHQAVQLLIEGGISPEHDQGEEGETWEKLFVIFMMLEQGVSGQRRELRHFVGAWLDDRLRIGPSDEERERIEPDLERQGWFVKDERLVIGEQVRRQRATSEPSDRVELHPLVCRAVVPKWEAGQSHDAIMAASKAVNAMLKEKLDRHDVGETVLVQEAFSANPPAEGKPRLRFPDIKDQKTRDSMTVGALNFGVGCFMAIRNPLGHLPDEQHEITEREAEEQLAAWSLFARWIERAEVEKAHT